MTAGMMSALSLVALFAACKGESIPAAYDAASAVELAVERAPGREDAEAPDVVARRYVELGAGGGDLEAARALVSPECVGDPVWDVDAARLMGVRIQASEITARLVEGDASRARVEVAIKGTAKAAGQRTTTQVFGKEVVIDVGSLEIGEASLSTTLTLARTAAGWRVACPR